MARIVVITHPYDSYYHRDYFLKLILHHVAEAGHTVMITASADQFVAADLAILHVDLTTTPPEYLDLARRYPRTLNLRADDIRKSLISEAVIGDGENWQGPVIVKTELNAHGYPEAHHNARAVADGLPPPYPGLKPFGTYRVFDRLDKIPKPLRQRDDLIAEKFLPEQDGIGYGLHMWTFFGSVENCNYRRRKHPMVKGPGLEFVRNTDVPDEMRAARAKLGLAYGKIDFVIHQGRPVLLDANKTLGAPAFVQQRIIQRAAAFAPGIEALLEDWEPDRGADGYFFEPTEF